ncbi:MAG: FtsW/RodA/SpoVE family cell cycle protein [Campylobacterales bacterium]
MKLLSDRRILTHFDFFILVIILPIIVISNYLISEVSPMLAQKQLFHFLAGFVAFFIFFLIPIRKIQWIIPFFYWLSIALLLAVEFIGITKLGAQRWLEIPIVHLTLQPSEIVKPAFILMLAYLIIQNPPPKNGYEWKDFLKISAYIIIPFVLILKQPDLGTALILLAIGAGVLFVIGVNKKIWISLIVLGTIATPLLYGTMHDYQKKRISDFLGEKPSYHVQQSVIAIGSGGITGKDRSEATQAQLKFLPIATSDFIFAYFVERFGFLGAFVLLSLYLLLIAHLVGYFISLKGDYFAQVVVISLALMVFFYTTINIAMTIGLAPVVGIPLPFFSYGGSSFVTFMILLGIIENLLAFRFNFLYNSNSF